MKIGILHVMPAAEDSPDAEIVKAWDRCLRKSMDRVKNPGTEIAFQVPRRGLSEDAVQYSYMWAFNEIETLRGYLEMGKDGSYDAISVMCFFDPKLREARQALNVPFVGPGEAAMRVASMMGKRFAVISHNENAGCEVADNIHKYGLSELALPVKGLPKGTERQDEMFRNGSQTIERFIDVAREHIAAGAEVIIPGCMIIDAIVHAAPGCEEQYPLGLIDVDGVPVFNVNQMQIKMAENLVALKEAGSPWISRKLYFKSSEGDAVAEGIGAPILEYDGAGFWTD